MEFHDWEENTCTKCGETLDLSMDKNQVRRQIQSQCIGVNPRKPSGTNFKGYVGTGLSLSRRTDWTNSIRIHGKYWGTYEEDTARMRLGTYVAMPKDVAQGFLDRAELYGKDGNSLNLSDGEFVIFESSTTVPFPEHNEDLLDRRASMVLIIAHVHNMSWLVTGYAFVL